MFMRRFHSYGPVNARSHFSVPRTDLVNQCLNSLIGSDSDNEEGHYFTIWAPRQTGKTWLTQQVRKRIEAEYPDQFTVGMMSMQGTILLPDDPPEAFLNQVDYLIKETFDITLTSAPNSWNAFKYLFHKDNTCFKRPLILFIDEFDSLPPTVIDRLVTLFRDIYLKRDRYLLHGLSLIGVRAVLGVDSQRGSPFNIQRSLHVPNFTLAEVTDLFDQYQRESSQVVESEVVRSVYESTNGQPGLVGWFGELLTEKYNPGKDRSIDPNTWETVHHAAITLEWNNTVLNLVKKVRMGYVPHVLGLFSRSDVSFSIDAQWCAYLYTNGVIEPKLQTDENGRKTSVCRFSCPFIQKRLYNALTDDLIGDRLPMLAIEPLDDLADVFDGETLNLPSLLDRYKAYLVRMKAKGLNPFKDQPRRTDLHYTEAVGHFHLYAWLQAAIGRRCVTSPEFPTGNGKVDIHIRCNGMKGIIEVKSFVDMSETRKGTEQAAAYARSLNLNSVTLALFVPVDDETVLTKLSGEHQSNGVTVTVVAIGWT
jgi:AAA-like domain